MEVVGKFSIDDKSKWFDLSLVIWVLVIMGSFIALEWILGLPPDGVGLGLSSLIVLICIIGVVVIHEGLHAIGFLASGGRVKFGHRMTRIGPSAYTTSPSSYPKRKFIAILLTPQILTIVLAALIPNIPPMFKYAFIIAIAGNFGRGFSDFYMLVWLRKFPSEYMVQDTIGGIEVSK